MARVILNRWQNPPDGEEVAGFLRLQGCDWSAHILPQCAYDVTD